MGRSVRSKFRSTYCILCVIVGCRRSFSLHLCNDDDDDDDIFPSMLKISQCDVSYFVHMLLSMCHWNKLMLFFWHYDDVFTSCLLT